MTTSNAAISTTASAIKAIASLCAGAAGCVAIAMMDPQTIGTGRR